MTAQRELFRLEALVEDRSGGMILAGLMEKVLGPRNARGAGPLWDLRIRSHRGLGALPEDLAARPEPGSAQLLGLLPAKLRAYRALRGPEAADVLLLVCDADNRDSRRFFNALRFAARSLAPELPLIIGLAVEEMEAWLLGDRAALRAAYPDLDEAALAEYEQDSICGTWEHLARAILGVRAEELIAAGYPAVGAYKAEWAAQIAPFLEPERNVSPSFRRFYKALSFVLDAPEGLGLRRGAARARTEAGS